MTTGDSAGTYIAIAAASAEEIEYISNILKDSSTPLPQIPTPTFLMALELSLNILLWYRYLVFVISKKRFAATLDLVLAPMEAVRLISTLGPFSYQGRFHTR